MNTDITTARAFWLRTAGFWLVLAMALLQMFYSIYAFTSPLSLPAIAAAIWRRAATPIGFASTLLGHYSWR